MVLGHDSFKGMGVDFGDLNRDGLYDMFVSNITTSFGLEESNFVWINERDGPGRPAGEARAAARRRSPTRARRSNLAWTGWGWDAKMADFDNSGDLAIVQATGFVKGDDQPVAELQELAMTNDDLSANPTLWPNVRARRRHRRRPARWRSSPRARRQVRRHQPSELGLAVPIPTRGIATGDADGDGAPGLRGGPAVGRAGVLPQRAARPPATSSACG